MQSDIWYYLFGNSIYEVIAVAALLIIVVVISSVIDILSHIFKRK